MAKMRLTNGAGVRVARDDRRFSRFGGGECGVAVVEAEFALTFVGIRSVALKTGVGEDRAHLKVVVDRSFRKLSAHERNRKPRRDQYEREDQGGIQTLHDVASTHNGWGSAAGDSESASGQFRSRRSLPIIAARVVAWQHCAPFFEMGGLSGAS